MRVMSATLKEIRHQKQSGAASEAWREGRGVRTVTKPTVSLENVSPAGMGTGRKKKDFFFIHGTQLCGFLFHLLFRAGRNPFAPAARRNQLKLIAVIKPYTGEQRAVNTVIVLLVIKWQRLRAEIINISHVLTLPTARWATFGGRLAAETVKEVVWNRMLHACEVKNKSTKQRTQSPEPHVEWRKNQVELVKLLFSPLPFFVCQGKFNCPLYLVEFI